MHRVGDQLSCAIRTYCTAPLLVEGLLLALTNDPGGWGEALVGRRVIGLPAMSL